MATKKETQRRERLAQTLGSLGFVPDEIAALRRISNTLQNWFEMECGTGEGQVSISIGRDGDEPDSKPYLRKQYPLKDGGYFDKRWPIADRETGARKRLSAIMAECNARRAIDPSGADKRLPLSFYVQGDCRGAALYILRPGDVPEGEDAGSYYPRGIVVY